MDVRLVMFVHSKVVQGRKSFRTMTEIGVEFWSELSKAYPKHVVGHSSPWALVELAAPKAGASGKEVAGARAQLRERTVTAEHVQSWGFTVDKKVVSSKSKETYTIIKFIKDGTHDSVQLKLIVSQDEEIVGKDEKTFNETCANLVDTYAVVDVTKEDTRAFLCARMRRGELYSSLVFSATCFAVVIVLSVCCGRAVFPERRSSR